MHFTATRQSHLFGGYHGLIPRASLLGAYAATNNYDYVKERAPLPYTAAQISGLFAPYATEAARMSAGVQIMNSLITTLQQAIRALEKFEADQSAWYGGRINNQSSSTTPTSKRLKNERADLRAEVQAAIAIAVQAAKVLTDAVNTKTEIALQEAGADPRNVLPTRDLETGAITYRRPTPQKEAAPQSASGMPSWLLPAAAAGVALFALKG